eukprot:NODE_90_length_21577_cov_0.697691.p10 type:complete len:299 gc:universal NODE_90_length_21577_cov_0.697691:12940-13836(+)
MTKSVQLFYAEWSKQSMNLLKVAEVWKKKYGCIHFQFINVDEEDIDVQGVPTIKLTDSTKSREYIGANVQIINKMLEELNSSEDSIPTDKDEPYNETILKDLVNSAPVMLFIKGTPSQPKCKFTRELLEIFKELNITFSHFDILSNEYVRLHLKQFGEWPTFPQIWLHGELLGGLDIIKELRDSQELQILLKDYLVETVEKYCERIVSESQVMIFIKGTPLEPRCGFSKTLVGLLNDKQVDYKFFNILENEEVRQKMKEIHEWPTYPMVFVNKELVGGLDIVSEMIKTGEFDDLIKEQ